MLRFFLLHLFFLVSPMLACTQTITWTGQDSVVNIINKTGYINDIAPKMSFDEIRQTEFDPWGKYIVHFSSDTLNTYWLKFSLNNKTSQDLILEFNSPISYDIKLHYQDTSGVWQYMSSGYKIPLADQLIKSPFASFPIPLQTGVQTYYISIYKGSNFAHTLKLWDSDSYYIQDNKRKLAQGFIFGMFLFVILYSLFLFISSREWMFLYFVLFVGFLLFTLSISNGFISYFVDVKDNLIMLFLQSIVLGSPWRVLVVLFFLNTKKHSPIWHKIGIAFSWYLIVFYIPFCFFPTLMVDNNIIEHNSGLVNAVQIISCIWVGIKGNRLGFWLLAALLVLYPFTLLYHSYSSTASPELIFGISYQVWGLLVQSLVVMFMFSRKLEWDRAASEAARRETQKELLEQTRETSRAIQDRNKVLQVANQKIQAAAQAKQEFLGMVSHELRTPMNAIIGFTELLKEDEPREDQKFYIENLDTSNKNMLRMIDNLLTLFDLDANKIVLEEKPFTLQPILLEELIQETRDANENPSLRIQLEIDERMKGTKVIGDAKRLKQILANLLDNAVKFTKEGVVVLKARLIKESESTAVFNFEVQDTGIGIAPEKMLSIFEAFSQGSDSVRRDFDGLGIGLPITKYLLELYNSDLMIESKPNEGSRFYFELSLPKQNI